MVTSTTPVGLPLISSNNWIVLTTPLASAVNEANCCGPSPEMGSDAEIVAAGGRLLNSTAAWTPPANVSNSEKTPTARTTNIGPNSPYEAVKCLAGSGSGTASNHHATAIHCGNSVPWQPLAGRGSQQCKIS